MRLSRLPRLRVFPAHAWRRFPHSLARGRGLLHSRQVPRGAKTTPTTCYPPTFALPPFSLAGLPYLDSQTCRSREKSRFHPHQAIARTAPARPMLPVRSAREHASLFGRNGVGGIVMQNFRRIQKLDGTNTGGEPGHGEVRSKPQRKLHHGP